MVAGWATLGATAAVGAAAVVATVRAQDAPPPPAPRPGQGGGFPGGPGGFPGGFMGPGRIGGPAPVSVAVGEGAVFVVRGNTIYKMNPQSLRVEGQTTLPEERRPRPGGALDGPDGSDLPPRPSDRQPGAAPGAPNR